MLNKLIAAVALLVVLRFVIMPKLKYFTASEFGVWWPLMNRDLLVKLDKFRELWGDRVVVSSADGALGRHSGEESQSQHNVDVWTTVNAVDIFPQIGSRGIRSAAERRRAYQIAKEVGFTGIGLYTDTGADNMLHVDVRRGRANDPAEWSRVNFEYLAIERVLV